MLIALLTVLSCVLLAACNQDVSAQAHQEKQRATSPAGRSILKLHPLTPPTDSAKSGRCKFPNVVRGADGRVYLSWIRRITKRRHALEFSQFDGKDFTPIRRIAEGDNWFVNWADFPSLAASKNGTLAAHWLERNGKGSYTYGIRVACSTDAGLSWHTPFWLHDDRQQTEHGFASIVPVGRSSFHAVWLDGRDFAEKTAMSLRSRRFNAKGPQSEDVLLDERVCDCCPTDTGLLGDGKLIAVYRDRSKAEIRDISSLRYASGKWTSSPTTCGDDRWKDPG